MDKDKGIQIARQPGEAGFSITVGGKKVETNGRPLALHFAEAPAYVYLLLDCSRSMTGYKLSQAKQGILDFAAGAFKNGYQVGLISFDTAAKMVCEPLRDAASLAPRVGSLRIGGSTNMAEGLRVARQRLLKLKGSRAIVIGTDGQPDNASAALREGKAARDKGIEIITIGTDDADVAFLEKLATRKELGSKVAPEVFARAIAQASRLLPPPGRLAKKP